MMKIIFPLIFSVVIWFMNYFVLKNTNNPIIYSSLIILFVGFTLLINQKKPSKLSRYLYFIVMLLFSIIAQLFIYFLIADLLKISRFYFLIFTLILTIYGLIHSRKIYIKKYKLNIGKKIVFLSDLHIGPANREKRITKPRRIPC